MTIEIRDASLEVRIQKQLQAIGSSSVDFADSPGNSTLLYIRPQNFVQHPGF